MVSKTLVETVVTSVSKTGWLIGAPVLETVLKTVFRTVLRTVLRTVFTTLVKTVLRTVVTTVPTTLLRTDLKTILRIEFPDLAMPCPFFFEIDTRAPGTQYPMGLRFEIWGFPLSLPPRKIRNPGPSDIESQGSGYQFQQKIPGINFKKIGHTV